MKKISYTTIVLGFWVVICLIVFAASFILYNQIRDANEESAQALNQIESINDQATHRAQEIQLAKTIEPYENQLSKMIVTQDGIDSFASILDSIDVYTKATSSIVNLTRTPEGESSTLENLGVSIQTKGSWREIFHALSLLESVPYAGRVETFTVSRSENQVLVGKVSKTVVQWEGSILYKALRFKQ